MSIRSFRWGSVAVLAWAVCCAGAVAKEDALRVSLVKSAGVNREGEERFFEPAGRVIEVERQPLHLLIEVKNISDSTARARGNDETSYSFEITDPSGKVTLMTRKKKVGEQSSLQVFKNLNPGEAVIITIDADRDVWEQVPVLVYGKKQTLKIRVIYHNYNDHLVYSPVYTLIWAVGSAS